MVPVAWAGALGRETRLAELEEAGLVDAIISFGEGVRERDILRDLERDLERGMSGSLTMTSGPAGL